MADHGFNSALPPDSDSVLLFIMNTTALEKVWQHKQYNCRASTQLEIVAMGIITDLLFLSALYYGHYIHFK